MPSTMTETTDVCKDNLVFVVVLQASIFQGLVYLGLGVEDRAQGFGLNRCVKQATKLAWGRTCN